MQQFQISLKNEKVKQYDRIALFITIINLSLFIYVAFAVTNKQDRIAAIAGAALVLIALSIDWKIDFWWIGVLCFAIGTLYFASKRILLVSISKEKIIYPSFPKKHIEWSQLNNIILKDGLLTIDFKNNKFIQQFIDDTNTALNEQEFNDFCGQQLNK